MKKTSMVLKAFLLCFALAGCSSHKATEKVDQEINSVKVEEEKSPAVTARESIMNSDELNADQKSRLLKLQETTTEKISQIKKELQQAKYVLIEKALEPKMNTNEFNALKKKIAKLEKEKMKLGFNAVSEARQIIDPKSKRTRSGAFSKAFINNQILDM